MENFITPIQVRWSDLDPNVHLRHSVYYDWGALARIEFLYQHGLSTEVMEQLRVGPILFREECVFKREIRLGDIVTIDLQLIKSKRDFSRWTIRHSIIKNKDIVAAILTLDGAWLDLAKRKLAIPPEEVKNAIGQMPMGEGFQWID
jgi:acyl-CoA thioester hydrolase